MRRPVYCVTCLNLLKAALARLRHQPPYDYCRYKKKHYQT